MPLRCPSTEKWQGRCQQLKLVENLEVTHHHLPDEFINFTFIKHFYYVPSPWGCNHKQAIIKLPLNCSSKYYFCHITSLFITCLSRFRYKGARSGVLFFCTYILFTYCDIFNKLSFFCLQLVFVRSLTTCKHQLSCHCHRCFAWASEWLSAPAEINFTAALLTHTHKTRRLAHRSQNNDARKEDRHGK